MNELNEIWQSIDDKQPRGEDALGRLLSNPGLNRLESHSPLKKLKLSLLMNVIFGALITLAYAWLVFLFPIWQMQLGLILVSVFNVWSMWTAWKMYQSLDMEPQDQPVLAELKRHRQAIHDWDVRQQRVGLWIYPIAGLAGFLLGAHLGSGESVAEFMRKWQMWLAIAIWIVVSVPIGYYTSRFLSRHAYGKHLERLQQCIDELEQANAREAE